MKKKEMEKFDVTKYVGEKTTIETAEVIEGKYGKGILLKTEIIPFKDDDTLGEGKVLRASIILNLKKDSEGEDYIANDSPMDKFLITKKIDPEELPEVLTKGQLLTVFTGINVTLQKNPKTEFLEFI